jgi:cytochrome c5
VTAGAPWQAVLFLALIAAVSGACAAWRFLEAKTKIAERAVAAAVKARGLADSEMHAMMAARDRYLTAAVVLGAPAERVQEPRCVACRATGVPLEPSPADTAAGPVVLICSDVHACTRRRWPISGMAS